ncbi:hypothetical protein HZA33_03805 [Candidatus Pacearchaeota archaeon]|nr:hypothetical protein [Candidatus Pacearchaeota archaeon]
MLINSITASKIKDSRKEDTISVVVETKDGKFEASAPSGKSKGKNERAAFSPKGVNLTIDFVNALGKKLENNVALSSFHDLEMIEEIIKKYEQQIMKGKAQDFEIIGANGLFALESALLKAIAASHGKELWQYFNEKPSMLPLPLGNIIEGAKHVKQSKKPDFQEFLVLPKTKHFFDAYFINLQGYNIAKKLVYDIDKDYSGALSDENAFAVSLDNEAVLRLLSEVRNEVQVKFALPLELGIDIAASSFYNLGNYIYKNKETKLTKEQQISFIVDLIEKFKLAYVEDPLHEEDFNGFSMLMKKINNRKLKCMITGDDLICTNLERLKKAVKEKCINALIVKPNQQGSLIETKKVVDFAQENGIRCVISHRSGETHDNTIAHLAVGWSIPIIKTGILGKERFAKLHELVRIERKIHENKKN